MPTSCSEGSILNDGLDLVTADRVPFLSFSVPPMTKSGWPTSIFFHQPTLEGLLRRTVLELGVDVRLSTSMTTIDQDTRKVTATLSDGSTVEAAYAVGCDGARSMTRTAIGADLEDLGFEESWLVVDLLGVDPGGGLPTRCLQVCDPARPHTVVPMPAPRFRFEFMLLEGETAQAMQEHSRIEELLAPWVDPGGGRGRAGRGLHLPGRRGRPVAIGSDPAVWRRRPPDAAVPRAGHVHRTP